jgi:hypothetical protein
VAVAQLVEPLVVVQVVVGSSPISHPLALGRRRVDLALGAATLLRTAP